MARRLKFIGALGAYVAMCLLEGCGNQYPNSVAGVPPVAAQISFNIVGDPGTTFTATITDMTASYIVNGTVPLTMVLVNDNPPLRVIATKTQANTQLMSLELITGFTIADIASTSQPSGVVSLSVGGTVAQIAPPAQPDVRFYVKQPLGAIFNALIEDKNFAYELENTAPAVFMFENPTGTVDGEFQQLTNLGPFMIDLTVAGTTVATAFGGPNVSIVQP